jgi:hypothetical protein
MIVAFLKNYPSTVLQRQREIIETGLQKVEPLK